MRERERERERLDQRLQAWNEDKEGKAKTLKGNEIEREGCDHQSGVIV